jgi:hypothetical protein
VSDSQVEFFLEKFTITHVNILITLCDLVDDLNVTFTMCEVGAI